MKVMNKIKTILILLTFTVSAIYVFADDKISDENVNIFADQVNFDNENEIVNADGNVTIEMDNIFIESGKATYKKTIDEFDASENVKIIEFTETGNNKYYSNKLITNKNFTSSNAKGIKIRMSDNSRIVGKEFKKEGDISIISDAQYTPCNEDEYLLKNCPGWKLRAKTVFHDDKTKTVYYDNAILYILNTPILYTPFFSHPDPSVNKRTGFLAPTIKNDNELGQVLSAPYFINFASNHDLTVTPTIQTTENNYLTTEYRLLNSKGLFNIKANVNDNEDRKGTRHYLFVDGDLESNLSKFNFSIQTTNNDTYMKKNQLNELNILKSGVFIEDRINNNYFTLEAKSYKHLSTTSANQWEYVLPSLHYYINSIDDPFFNGNLSNTINFLYTSNLSKNKTANISSEFAWNKETVDGEYGLVFSNYIETRVLYNNINYESNNNDSDEIRLFPQFSTKISLPMSKNSQNFSQTLSPILMPVVAPYNNYTTDKVINPGNIFSRNRASSLSEWESGPRINYGLEWYIAYQDLYDAKFLLGQSIKKNKESSNVSDEVSDYMLSSSFGLGDLGFLTSNFIIDKNDVYIKDNTSIASIGNKKLKIVAEYEYTSDKFGNPEEQIGIGTKINLFKNIDVKYSGKRDLYNDTNIGYETGLYYENDCLAVQFRYYRDLTKYKDVADSEGVSFSITLKPFGEQKTYGRSKVFGPDV